jgi:hypothetical protein
MKKIAILLIAALVLNTSAIAKVIRSQSAKVSFKKTHPCPANGVNHGPCKGYVIDHIRPLACKGADAPYNMQWQTKEEAKSKDKWERKHC